MVQGRSAVRSGSGNKDEPNKKGQRAAKVVAADAHWEQGSVKQTDTIVLLHEKLGAAHHYGVVTASSSGQQQLYGS